MSTHNDDYGWLGWMAAIVIGVVFMMYVFNSSSNGEADATNSSETAPTISEPAAEAVTESEPPQDSTSWNCMDATSYNQNAYDDNECTKGAETQYVSDSQAIELDPSYSPGKAGASYYNSQ